MTLTQNITKFASTLLEAVGWSRPPVYEIPAELVPDTITATATRLDIGAGCSRTFLVVGYPAEVPAAWTQVLVDCGAWVDVSIHIGPFDTAEALSRLRKRRARLESSRRHAADKEQLDDPEVEAAAADAAMLAGRLATGGTRLYRTGVYVTVHAPNTDALDTASSRLISHATAAMLDARPASWRQLPGATSTLPLGVDALGAHRTLDTDAVAAAFPLVDPDTPASDSGVLYGVNAATGSPVIWDRWAADNHNSLVVARSGSGKSFFAKTEILRQLYDGVEIAVVDPDGEYTPLASYVGGNVITPGEADTGINPLELPADPGADALTRRVMFASTLVSTLLGEELDSDENAALGGAVHGVYVAAGITSHPGSWHHRPPTMADVYTALAEAESPAAHGLAARLAPYCGPGALSSVFTTPTRRGSASALTVYQLHRLPDELVAAVTLAVLDRVWNGLVPDGVRRLVVVDEAWLLLRTGPGATYLSRLAKAARKRRAGLMAVTQDAEDMASSDLGRVIIANAATSVLMRQSPQSIDLVAEAFGLTDAEAALLVNARRGEALLRSGDVHVAFSTLASPDEEALMRTGMSAAVDDAGGGG